MRKIIWIKPNPGASRDECGYWESLEGRFSIHPKYRSTVNPSSYEVRDNLKRTKNGYQAWKDCDTVRDCKQWAQDRLTSTDVQ